MLKSGLWVVGVACGTGFAFRLGWLVSELVYFGVMNNI